MPDLNRVMVHSAEILRPAATCPRGHGQDVPVLPGSTERYHEQMSGQAEISQRDLRIRSKEIVDAVEHGQSFNVTRDGREIGELVPLHRRRRFVNREEFGAASQFAATVDLTAFRADQDATYEQVVGDPYAR